MQVWSLCYNVITIEFFSNYIIVQCLKFPGSKRPPHPHITVTIITIITTTTTALLEQRTSKAMPYKVSNLSPVMIPPRTPTLDLVKRVSSTSNYQMLLPPVSHVQVQCASTLIYLLNFFNFFHWKWVEMQKNMEW